MIRDEGSLERHLRKDGFAILTHNAEDTSKHGPFEAWAYQGPLDLQKAAPVTFGVGTSIPDSIDALDLQLDGHGGQSETQEMAASSASDTSIHLCVDRRELATILAALRFHQDENLQDDRRNPDAAIDDIATDGGVLLPLDFKEVGELCERLNTSEETQTKGLVIEPPHEEHGDQPLFRVVYVIDVNAVNPQGAAGQTHRIITNPDSQPPVLEVIDHHGEVVRVDLSEDVAAMPPGEKANQNAICPAIGRIHDLLYLDMDGGREFYNPDKSWDADTTAAIAEVVAECIPRPEVKP